MSKGGVNMNKLNKVYSFHISELEKDAIMELRNKDMNVSRFLRGALRRFSDQLRLQNERNENKVEGGRKL